ncbi:serine protease [Pseudoalteromonas ruthenica]|uniref:S8 family serine peptidase n=1 Tax=Pseudoalteromonas ruthenica TaxID=151081 RepID=UPI001108E8DE|nr:S8 family serine peptidase [Pseudoalteromonas ruthenica]TLX51870.1 serine protease [Pseudoalteromonas ruthenica]
MNNNKIKLSALTSAMLIALSGCGGSDSDDQPVVDTAPKAGEVSLEGVKQWQPMTGTLIAHDQDGDAITLTFYDEDQVVAAEDGIYTFSHGTLALGEDKEFIYTSLSGQPAVINYDVSANGKTSAGSITISDVTGDPLAAQQWHLHNNEQRAFAQSDIFKEQLAVLNGIAEQDQEAYFAQLEDSFVSSRAAGADMNVLEAYKLGITGKGSIAVVVDQGVEIGHEDLADNVLAHRSLNLRDDALDPTNPTITGDKTSRHGTAVAGLIAAKAHNGVGGRGVAPDAGIISMNFLDIPNQNAAHVGALISGLPASGIQNHEQVVFNRSYGYTPPAFLPEDPFEEANMAYASDVLRDGKGALSINAAGNDFEEGRHNGNYCSSSGVNDIGLSCIDINVSQANRSLHSVSVAALKANGERSSYSIAGSAMFIAAPAGEDGSWEPAMVTTDEMTCLQGASGLPMMDALERAWGVPLSFLEGYKNFDFPGHPMNPSCHYSNSMSGTSSAAPNTAGVVALLMEANPDLSARDIQHILATTASMTDADNATVTLNTANGEFVAHQGWVENAAGYHFNNFYGFGRVNAGEAVKMALNYDVDLGERSQSDWLSAGVQNDDASLALVVPDNNAAGATHSIEVADDYTIEAMQFSFTVANEEMRSDYRHPEIPGLIQSSAGSDLAIEVTSPSGTKSVVLASHHAQLYPALDANFNFAQGYVHLPTVHFRSNAFYGESAKGTWTVKVVDTAQPNQVAFSMNGQTSVVFPNEAESVLEGWGLRVTGRQ